MERARIDGAELEYEVAGTGEPVIFIHGAIIADAFRPLLSEPVLAGHYQLILYHRRGYAGSSRAPKPISIAQQASDCYALLQHLGVKQAHLVGHSYGGAVALQLALDASGTSHTLALLEPALMVGANAQGYREALTRGVERYRADRATAVVDEFLQARCPEYTVVLERRLPGAFAQAVADAGTTFEGELPGLLDWHFGEAEAQHIRQPTLVLLGGKSDALWPRFGETHRLLLAWLTNGEGFVLPDATHFLQLEDPRDVAEALAAFWSCHAILPRTV